MIKYTELKKKSSYTRKMYDSSLEEELRFQKDTILFDSIRGKDNLVKVTSEYPSDNKLVMNLEVDLVIMTRSQFDKLNKNE